MIVYAITSHGYGHAVRSCEILRHLPAEIPLTLRTSVPESFLRRELPGRAFEILPARFDCGTLGPDSTSVDLAMTLDAAEPILAGGGQRADEEADLLRRLGARVVVTDIAPLPLRAAKMAGIPSILMANFTWPAIFRPLLEGAEAGLRRRAEGAIAIMDNDYAQGDLLLVPGFDIPMSACRERRDVPLIARRGRPSRPELARGLGLDLQRPIILLYVGADGRQGVQWERLADLPEAQFVAYRPPAGSELWVREIPQSFHHADVVASVDGVVAKPGYSMMAECLCSGTPVLTSPRPQFIEAEIILRAVLDWGGGACIPEEDFLSLNWGPWVEQLPALKKSATPLDSGGGAAIADIILQTWKNGRPPKDQRATTGT